MITKGVITEILDKYTMRVRIPIFDRIDDSSLNVLNSDLLDSPICTLPNTDPNLRPDDIVVIGFEDNDYSRPVILGCLYCSRISSYPSINADSLNVLNGALLPEDTSIGKVNAQNIKCLEGCIENIQSRFDYLETYIRNVEKKVQTHII